MPPKNDVHGLIEVMVEISAERTKPHPAIGIGSRKLMGRRDAISPDAEECERPELQNREFRRFKRFECGTGEDQRHNE